MKKISMLFVAAVLLAGCSSQQTVSTSSDNKQLDLSKSQEQSSAYGEDNLSRNMQSESPVATDQPKQNTMDATTISDSVKLEDLASQYHQVIIKTNQGDIKVGLYASDSPLTVNNFLNLAKSGFYDGTKFHRVIKNFMIQGGDPNSKDDDWSNDGVGGPDYRFRDEFNGHKLVRGSLAMANAGPNTNGSQFFIVTAESTPWLDGKHTNFGQVVDGMDIVDKIENAKTNQNDHPLDDMTVNSIELVK